MREDWQQALDKFDALERGTEPQEDLRYLMHQYEEANSAAQLRSALEEAINVIIDLRW